MNLLTGTIISQLPTGTVDNLQAVFPLSIGMPSSPQTIQASLAQVAEQGFNNLYQLSGTSSMQNGTAVLSSIIALTGTAGAWQDSLQGVTLPVSGTYKIHADIRTQLVGNAGTSWWLSAELYNQTDGAEVANSERILIIFSATTRIGSTSSLDVIVSVSSSKEIRLRFARNGEGSPSWTESFILSDANGRSSISYVRIK